MPVRTREASTSSPARRSPVGLAAILEALPTRAALLAQSGVVIAANELWHRFHAEQGWGDGSQVGANYVDACDAAIATQPLAAGIRQVLSGEREEFEREDEVAAAETRSWYRTVVRRIVDERFDGAIVLRIDVTPQHELSERHHRAQLELERRVSERTADLSRANVLLQYEIGERRRASTERNQLLEEVRLERRLLAAVLAQMPLGVMIAEAPSGRVVLHNDQLVRLVGRPLAPAGSALESAGGHAFHPDGAAYRDDEDPLARALRGESVDAEEIEFERADGVRVILRASAVPVRDERGDPIAAVVAFYDVTEWRTTERQLRASETRYRLASRSIKDAIWDYDVVANRIEWSDGITTRFGHPPDTIAPALAWWLEQIDSDDRARVAESLRFALDGDATNWEDEYRFRCFDGRFADVIDRGFIVRDAAGRPTRAVGAMEDISERRKAESERAALLARERRARADAEAANRAKDEFLAVVSHELRTPLAPILGFVEILREDALSADEQRAALTTIERNARSLSHLIDDLLDVSRITSGKLSLEYAPVEMGDVVAAVFESARPTAEAKGVRLTLTRSEQRSIVRGDAARLTQVLANLLANALKFTPAGGTIDVELDRVGTRVVVRVRDSGKGITADLLPHVFERFRQGDTSDTRVHGGLGLGLAIVSQIVDLHGGAVRAESAGEGRGATFTVELPLTTLPRG